MLRSCGDKRYSLGQGRGGSKMLIKGLKRLKGKIRL
jgi:hypothetical protein